MNENFLEILSRQNEKINFQETLIYRNDDKISKIIVIVTAYDVTEICHHSIVTKNLRKFRL